MLVDIWIPLSYLQPNMRIRGIPENSKILLEPINWEVFIPLGDIIMQLSQKILSCVITLHWNKVISLLLKILFSWIIIIILGWKGQISNCNSIPSQIQGWWVGNWSSMGSCVSLSPFKRRYQYAGEKWCPSTACW